MSSYRGHSNRSDRVKAAIAVGAVHVALAAVILTGLNVQTMRRAVETMTTIAVVEPEPPPEPPPPPEPKPDAVPEEAGAPGKKAEPTPVVAPPSPIPTPSPIPAAPVAGTGSATTTGAAAYGTGTGAGGSGTGRGGGGTAGYTPARRITKIPDREYRRLASTGIPSGSVGITVKVNEDGSASNCRVARSSGDRNIDALMCQLTIRHVRFDPARDPSGRPVAQDVTFVPNWWRP